VKQASAISTGTRLLVQLFLLVLVIASIFPLYNVIVASFKSGDEFVANPFFPPRSPISANFVYAAVNASLLRYAVNSLILVPSGLVLYLAVCISAGYAFGKMRFRLKRPLFLLVLFLTIFPLSQHRAWIVTRRSRWKWMGSMMCQRYMLQSVPAFPSAPFSGAPSFSVTPAKGVE